MNDTLKQMHALIDAAEKYAQNFNDDDREGIKADVMNAFFAGSKFEESRRAQPEGEAPQAVVQVHLDNDNWMDVASSELPTWERKGFKTRTLFTSPAAQQAESDTQTGLLDELAVAMREHCSKHDNYLSNLLRRARASLAAQSQGAPVNSVALNLEANVNASPKPNK